MNQNNGSVPPLPPRRCVISMVGHSSSRASTSSPQSTVSSSDAKLLQSVPPPPQHSKYNDLINLRMDCNQNDNSLLANQFAGHTVFNNNQWSTTRPVTTSLATPPPMSSTANNSSYIQWQNQSVCPTSLMTQPPPPTVRPSMWSMSGPSVSATNRTSAFFNYSYSSSAGVSPVSPVHGLAPIATQLSHSLSAPTFSSNGFSNTTYNYSFVTNDSKQTMTSNSTTFEDIKKLVTNGNSNVYQTLVSSDSKSKSKDLIDLNDNENKNVLQLFDPLSLRDENNENELNFSNNFELDETDNTDNDVIGKMKSQTMVSVDQPQSAFMESKKDIKAQKDDKNKDTISYNDINEPFRVTTKKCRSNEELDNFSTQLIALRQQFKYNDYISNSGLVISPTLDSQRDTSLSVKLIIETQLSQQPVSFTCNVETSIEHIISHVICTLVEDASNVKMDDYVLKVYGLTEYFAADSLLANYLYIHQCLKFDKDVHLSLVYIRELNRLFARTMIDDNNIDFTVDEIIPKAIIWKFSDLNTETINILLENFDREISKLRADARMSSGGQLQSQSIIQTVKAICTHLSSLETIALTESAVNFSQLCNAFGTYKRDSITALNDNTNDIKIKQIPDFDAKLWEILDNALCKLRTALIQLIYIYSQTFPVEFEIDCDLLRNKKKTKKDISSSMDTLLCYIGVCCQLQPEWMSTFKEYKLRFRLIHGDHNLSTATTKTVSTTKYLFNRLTFDEWLPFDWPIFNLPREVKLEITLIGIKNLSQTDGNSSPPTVSSGTGQDNKITVATQELGIGYLQLFDHKQVLVDGQYLIPLWINSPEFSIETDAKLINSFCCEKTNPIVHICFPETEFEIRFPAIIWDQSSDASKLRRSINSLDSATQTELYQLLKRNPLETMSCGEREQLWDRRYYLYDCPEALPKVLLASHSWEPTALSDIYQMMQHWSQLSPIDSMQLLMPSYPDIYVRQITVKWLKKLTSDELCDFMPQLIQALRFDAYMDSPLFWFLLESALTSVRVCHHLYWILKCNINDQTFTYRSRIYLNSLLAIIGKSTNLMIDRQEYLCRSLSQICDHVKTAKESQRLTTLLNELESVNDYLIENPTVLPLTPSMLVCSIDVKLCSYFPSNSLPLKLVFKNPDTKTSFSSLEAIFKVGDDLRQDMLSMQMIQIMDKVWLKEGLDLRMVTFGCMATDFRKGFIEMVRYSETLRKIQLEHGLTGSFKDRPIYEWLQKHNTSELEYHNAVENFTYSCAGYSVATYLLGICDRHNDNIMLTTSGHLFHIDFGKFLGDAQMMAGIKRDRVAFVLTQDMAYVINGGDKPSKAFQFFVDLCCQSFNCLRRNANFLLSLFSLMMSSRISGLNTEAIRYIHKALMPGLSESEAMSQFTRMIEESLRSRFTKFNFFIHNLAQLRFTGDHNDQMLLSFIPKKFTKESDGEITALEVVDCYKKYEQEKVYYYSIRVDRQFQPDPSFIHRSYREFIEFNDKITVLYPLAKFHVLPRSSNLIRSNTRDVAVQRMHEIKQFVSGLMRLAHEISHSDIVYTFFHPLLRDQEGVNTSTTINIASPSSHIYPSTPHSVSRRDTLYGPTITGQVKLSIVYKNMSLVIMIMHAKNLQSCRSTAPDCYVKTYLNPDPSKVTKRKTRIINKSCHPTFMEMIVYHGIPIEKLQQKTLQVSVWDYDRVTENVLIGGTHIILNQLNLKRETCDWFALQGN
ncbi:phosphatidylinositol 4-phosphate 3-kinase C2 domain-containing subunit alpha-like [Oppia nitens]|uniref:phosphatidylinositol 4-phosphate 3-kinase C2 domain-containing subunit alpha-like n=1 Tax=Oppia nitens TaxID=1686743 RepID=UPI0023DAC4CF|nr:phosphatidylinositol 4-phosphate 3-kinase C2 domain-containing subunit alpha-like [Oppia nitens]